LWQIALAGSSKGSDGLTARGGRTAIILEDGERIEIDITQRSSFITGHDSDHGGPNSYVCSENVSHTRINGREGVCCFTICNDVTGMGEEVMMVLDRYATLTDGLSSRKSGSQSGKRVRDLVS
jgi:hypothetical protein